jgi:hypothetical protein
VNQRLLLLSIAFLILVSLLAGPALAATVTCPASCSCLLPAEAAKIKTPGLCGGMQTVCGNEGKINKYCYARPASVTTTTALPQLIATGFHPVTTTTTVPAFVKCSPDCSCEYEPFGEKTDRALCGGVQYLCGMDHNGVPKYCYVRPPPRLVTGLEAVTPDSRAGKITTVPTTMPPPTATVLKPGPSAAIQAIQPVTVQNLSSCPAGCACLRPADAEAKGLRLCNGKQTPCTVPAPLAEAGTGPVKETRYCYSMVAGSSVPAPVLIPAVIKASPIPIPPGPGMASSAAGPASGGDVLSIVGSFFSSVLGGNPQRSPSGEVSLSMCKARYGLDTCADGCVNLSTDPDNCGSCGHWCRSGERCLNGRCSDFGSDPSNCGGAGNVCPAGAPCIEGYCSALGCLDSAMTACNNTCTRTRNDPANCGTCGNACPSGQACSSGNCSACPAAGEVFCPGHEGSSAGCTNPFTDLYNCGRCQHACGITEVCRAGECSGCPEGTEKCGGSCIDLMTSNYSCGRCGNRCSAAQTCVMGNCTCPEGTWVCGMSCVDLRTSNSSCGRCGTACPLHASCNNGICICDGYDEGVRLCGGACTDTRSDDTNCGYCNNNCGSVYGTPRVCRDGRCIFA